MIEFFSASTTLILILGLIKIKIGQFGADRDKPSEVTHDLKVEKDQFDLDKHEAKLLVFQNQSPQSHTKQPHAHNNKSGNNNQTYNNQTYNNKPLLNWINHSSWN